MSLRLGLVADGAFTNPRTNSGVARGLLHGLAVSDGVSVVFARSTRPEGLQRSAVLAASFRLNRAEWRRHSHQGALARRFRSRNRDRHLPAHEEVDLLIHVRNVYEPPAADTAFAAFIDTTSVQSARWGGWASRGLTGATFKAEKKYFGAAKHVFTASAAAAESVVEDYGVDPAKVFAVGGGTNFLLPPEQAAARSAGEVFRMMFVGVDPHRKGSDIVVEAVRVMRATGINVEATLVGAGSRLSEPGITGTDPVWDRDELSRLFTRHHAFIFPARHEPYGLVVQEAMAHGSPVIVSNVGALPLICEHGITGIVCAELTSESVAEVARRLFEHPTLAAQMGQRGRERAYAEFSWERVAERIIKAAKTARP